MYNNDYRKYLPPSLRSKDSRFRLKDFGLTIAFWAVFFGGGSIINSCRNERIYLNSSLSVINSVRELEDILKEEKKEAGLENVNIQLKISEDYIGGHCIRTRDNSYRLTINPARMSRLIIRHELYHIRCWENGSWWNIGPIQEWNATSYSISDENN